MSSYPKQTRSVRRPPVLSWYRAYCGFMAFVYIALAMGVVILQFLGTQALLETQDISEWLYYLYMGLIFALSTVLGGAFITAFFLKPSPWSWVFHLVLIAIGLTSPCCMPATVPLLIFWIKPETQSYFGRSLAPSA